jgi:hypothetical protein
MCRVDQKLGGGGLMAFVRSDLCFSVIRQFKNISATDVYMLGDFNCDLMHPNKPPMDGRDLNDLLDIYNFTNLINSPTRIDKTSETLLD